MIRPWLCCVVLLPALAGCGVKDTVSRYLTGGEDNVEPPAPLVEFTPRLNVIQLWTSKAGGGTDKQYLRLTPAVAGQRLYVAGTGGTVAALDATNGKTLWTTRVRETITGGPGVGENSVLVGTLNGKIILLNAETGREQWRAQLTSEVLAPPARAEGTVVARTIDGKVFGLDARDGKRLWIYDRTVPSLTLRGTSSPKIDSGIVVAGFDAGRLAGLELRTGRLLWEATVAASRGRSELERMVDIDADPVIVDGVVYVSSYQGQLAAVQLESGRVMWNRETSSHAGISIDDSSLFLTDHSSHVMAFDRYGGTSIWKQDKLTARGVTGPAVIGDYVVVGDLEGYLHWMDKSDGRFVARTRIAKERIIAQPVVVGSIVYAYATDGSVAAFTYR
jgi:outer membrane protein assembly factor BamB